MEGISSATSPLGEPMVPMIANYAPTLSEMNSPMLLIDDFSSPKKKQSISQEVPTLWKQFAWLMKPPVLKAQCHGLVTL